MGACQVLDSKYTRTYIGQLPNGSMGIATLDKRERIFQLEPVLRYRIMTEAGELK